MGHGEGLHLKISEEPAQLNISMPDRELGFARFAGPCDGIEIPVCAALYTQLPKAESVGAIEALLPGNIKPPIMG